MCGRYQLSLPIEELEELFQSTASVHFEVRYNIAPTQKVPIIRHRQGQRHLDTVHWGLVPEWAADKTMASRMINARSETVAEKPSFRESFRYRRCLIPATGFYEWARENRKKTPYLVTVKSQPVYAMAGIWSHWKGPGGDYESCAVITTEAAASIRHIHERMPVILHPSQFTNWLDSQSSKQTLLNLCIPIPDEFIHVRAVSDHVNSARNDDPRCEADPVVQGVLF